MLSLKEIVSAYHVSESTLRTAIRTRALHPLPEASRAAGKYLFAPNEIERWMKTRTTSSAMKYLDPEGN